MNSFSAKLKTGVVVAMVFAIGGIVMLFRGAGSGSSPVASTTTDTSVSNSQTSSQSAATSASSGQASASGQTPPVATNPKYTYKNGTYSADGSYDSPGGPDSIGVTLTLQNDIVTNVSVTPNPGDRTSARYQNAFISGYKQYVIGKNISGLNLGKVSGSSLTPIGFNNALTQIKAQAKV